MTNVLRNIQSEGRTFRDHQCGLRRPNLGADVSARMHRFPVAALATVNATAPNTTLTTERFLAALEMPRDVVSQMVRWG